MFNKKIIIGLIILLFLTCGVASAFDLFGDGLEPEDIYVEQFVCGGINFTDINSTRYVYDVDIDLKNVSTSLVDSKIVTYFYSNGTLITSNDKYNNNTTIIEDDALLKEFNHVSVRHELWADKYFNITSCDIVIYKDGKVVFNETKPYYMGNLKDDDEILGSSSSTNAQDNSSSSSSGGSTFVASSNSNKFHEPYCSQAQRISDANKITFSSRDEAINESYEPCEICYP